jgi:hypothetical protein
VHVVHIYLGAAVVVDSEHVDVGYGLADDYAFRAVVFHQPVIFFEFLRFLKTEF